jgi:dienelactone hydrolase
MITHTIPKMGEDASTSGSVKWIQLEAGSAVSEPDRAREHSLNGDHTMNSTRISLLLVALACCGCAQTLPAPDRGPDSSIEAVQRSLDTVDPEAGLPLFAYDPTEPFDIRDEVEHDVDGLQQIDFTYASPRGGRVPARLIVPRGKGRFPAIVYMHGSSGDIELMTPEARYFARLGAAGLLIDSPHIRPGGYAPDGSMGSTWPYFTEQDRLDQIQLIVDLQRAVDLLIARSDIDGDRLAYLGISYGGAMGGLLAGVETRIKAYVLIVGDGGLVEHTSRPDAAGWPDHFSQAWVELMWPIEPLHYVGRAAPAALLFQNGLSDRSVSPDDALRYQAAGSEPKNIIWYDGGHEISGWTAGRTDRAKWLQDFLGQPLFWFEPNYRSSMVWVDRICSAWAVLSLLTAAYLLWAFHRVGAKGYLVRMLWCLAAVILGPLSLPIYRFSMAGWPHHPAAAAPPGGWRSAVAAATYIGSAMAISLLFGIMLDNVIAVDSIWLQLGMAYLIPLGLFYALLARLQRELVVRPAARLLLANVLWAVAVPLGSWLSQRMNMTTDLDLRLWWTLVAGGLAGCLLAVPLAQRLMKLGWIHWAARPQTESARTTGVRPGLAALASMLLLPVSVGVVILLSSGLSLPELITALR